MFAPPAYVESLETMPFLGDHLQNTGPINTSLPYTEPQANWPCKPRDANDCEATIVAVVFSSFCPRNSSILHCIKA
eukprot:1612742-Amphidinium_carterae.1